MSARSPGRSGAAWALVVVGRHAASDSAPEIVPAAWGGGGGKLCTTGAGGGGRGGGARMGGPGTWLGALGWQLSWNRYSGSTTWGQQVRSINLMAGDC